MFRVAPLVLMLSFSACSRAPDQPAPVHATSAPQHATGAASTAAPPRTSTPAKGEVPRYVGRWASRADLCEGGAWTFTRNSAGLEDGPICHFESVSEIPGGYRITATCEQGGNSRRSVATLRFAESAHAMLVENLATLPDTGLVRCGTAPQSTEGERK
jgi:hypothetical protein